MSKPINEPTEVVEQLRKIWTNAECGCGCIVAVEALDLGILLHWADHLKSQVESQSASEPEPAATDSSPRQRLYATTTVAFRTEPGGRSRCGGQVGICQASSESEARGLAWDRLMAECPADDGWQSHVVAAGEILPSIIAAACDTMKPKGDAP